MKPEPMPAALQATTQESVLARHHRLNLVKLHRVPRVLDYVAPEEILVLVRLCSEYGIDYTLGLEPRQGDLVRNLRVVIEADEGMKSILKPCRVRREVLLENSEGSWLPAGDIVWANQVLGQLQDAVTQRLEAALGVR